MSSLHQSLLAFFRAMALLATGISVLLAVAAARGATETAGLDEHEATPAEGCERRWSVYRPERPREPADVVFVLHGSGGKTARVRADGHAIPQPGGRFPGLLGPHAEDVDVPAEAWIFSTAARGRGGAPEPLLPRTRAGGT